MAKTLHLPGVSTAFAAKTLPLSGVFLCSMANTEEQYKTGAEFEIEQPAIPALVARKKKLISKVEAMDLPMNPIDSIIDALGGPTKVAEMTGRGTRIVRRAVGKTTELRYETRSAGEKAVDSLNITERKAFQAGKKLVAIISDAASTGVSLQADKRCKNRRRRVHITLELPWSADKAVQQLGRSHRSNQRSSPCFKLLISNIGAEWRFASAVASRLEQLGALTQGDRRATTGSASHWRDCVILLHPPLH